MNSIGKDAAKKRKRFDEAATYYACDPAKNTGCTKETCYYRETSLYRVCLLTKNPAYARTDRKGNPKKRSHGPTLREILKVDPIRWQEIAIPAATAAIASLLLLWLQGR